MRFYEREIEVHMNIRIVCVGRLKEKSISEACAEYEKRLSRYCSLEIAEAQDLPAPEQAGLKRRLEIMRKEGERAKKLLLPGAVIALDMGGKAYDSLGFAEMMDGFSASGVQCVNFLIGGSLGLDEGLKSSADIVLSLSSLTFPHNLARLLLLEQLYRAARINAHQPYHK